ncbi:MAG: AmmeMemoRadiSam system radical SAM enzyme [Deltaproteobacteria bacterium]|nr:AmmeMemoRadiSam system radical SAM enzyme [Deltaproteobacteria bacterium]
MGSRRLFMKRVACGLGMGWLGYEGFEEFVLQRPDRARAIGFHNDAPATLDQFSRPAEYFHEDAGLVRCDLCPHECELGEDDRGFCRVRVVKGGRMHTVAYGNLCSINVDPIEKKPLYHFLPRSPIVSVAMGGCNLRCRNCQNWEISQAKPEDVQRFDALPEKIATLAIERGAPSIAYTYTEPLVTWEYVRDTATEARRRGIKNVLVTAGFINEKPLRELCRVIDAVTLDVKAFNDRFYREVSGGRLHPVLKALEVFRQEGVWVEVSFLMVPTLSDDPSEVGKFSQWVVERLGRETPLHLLRFHPAHKLMLLPPTPLHLMQAGREAAVRAGLCHVYLGNVPGADSARTVCPHDGQVLIERDGFRVLSNRLKSGACPACGRKVAGVFSV